MVKTVYNSTGVRSFTTAGGHVFRAEAYPSSYEMRYRIACVTGEPNDVSEYRLLEIKNAELFEFIAEGACNVFEKVFKNFDPVAEYYSPFLFGVDYHESWTIALVRNFDCRNAEERFFAAVLMYRALELSSEKDFPESVCMKRVRDHMKMLADAKKLNLDATFDPWGTQFGFTDHKIFGSTKISMDGVKYFLAKPDQIDFFKRFCLMMQVNEIGSTSTLSSFDPKLCDTTTLSRVWGDFAELPFENEEFRERLLSMTVNEIRSEAWNVPKDAGDHAVAILEKNLESTNPENKQALTDFASGTFDIVINNISSLKDYEKSGFSLKVNIEKRAKDVGYQKFLRGFFAGDVCAVDSFSELSKVVCITMRNSETYPPNNNWVIDTCYEDYTLLKLTEILGAKETFGVIRRVLDEDMKLTFHQWMEYAERYDELQDVPVAWVSALLGADR